MLCSARELGEEQDGIMELGVDVPPGTPFLKALPIGDETRRRCWREPPGCSHLGLAREIAAITRSRWRFRTSHGLARSARGHRRNSGRAGSVDVRVAMKNWSVASWAS
jgi:hypothetical protein